VLVVPIQKDSIETKDGAKYKVVEYTNYKEGGPAVYAKSPTSKEVALVYFFDIQSINGTKVEYQRGTRVFHALGKISRDQHLPQPDDKIVVLDNGISDDDDETGKQTAKVDSLKLKSKALGINKGMFVKDDDGKTYRLKQILDIEPSLGGASFNREAFLKYYKDYTGV
jgi:hypothetical protein